MRHDLLGGIMIEEQPFIGLSVDLPSIEVELKEVSLVKGLGPP